MANANTQINITLGTAGHIDHGKTALIRLLTGCETDRLKEEKERGMSIELGFAPCRMGDLEVGIVDVPGHEHFIKTMVAGATGIDGVIFVVAADDGIMPQTREHLDILTLLGVKDGLVALTKIDIVTEDRVRTVTEELKSFLQGTFLEGAAICPLSTITGAGFDGFYTSLKELIGRIGPKSTEGVFQMPIERAFSVKGFGTIVSGIPASGRAEVGDELILQPGGVRSRIRAIQVYGKESTQVKSGQCAAINLPQLEAWAVHRGQVLTKGGYLEPAQWFICSLRLLKAGAWPVKNGRSFKFHTGTSEVTAVVYVLDDRPSADGSILVQVRTEQPVAAAPCNSFILRDLSPMRTIAGGYIVEAGDRRIKHKPELLKDLHDRAEAVCTPETFIEYCLRNAGDEAAGRAEGLAMRAKQTPEKVRAVLQRLVAGGRAVQIQNDFFMHTDKVDEFREEIVRIVEAFHLQNPQSPGMDEESLLGAFGGTKLILKAVLNLLLTDRKLILTKDRYALPTHREQFDPKQKQLLERVEGMFLTNLFNPPSMEEVAAAVKVDSKTLEKTVKLLTEQQVLLRVEQGMYFHRDAIAQAKSRIAEHVKGEGQGRLESVDFKYLIETTRKYAIPLLDYMDKIGFTRRSGNTRYLK
jgi:selenocysteine-specific elongation factor